jgi:hypothetical protein
MATVAEFVFEPSAVSLGSILDAYPTATIELERVVPLDHGLIPYFWISGVGNLDEGVSQSSAQLRAITVVEHIDDEVLCRAEWGAPASGFLKALAESQVVLLSAVCTADGWTVLVRGEDRADVRSFRTACESEGVMPTLERIHPLTPLRSGHEYTLTDTQRTALLLAYERGYFDSPRRTTLEELAGELDITRQALASRLRRGHRRLIEATLART